MPRSGDMDRADRLSRLNFARVRRRAARRRTRRRRRWCPLPARSASGTRCRLRPRIGAKAKSTVIGNTGDDITLFGLRVCPDLDTVMYTLGGGIHEEQGWGRAGETFAVKDELVAYGAQLPNGSGSAIAIIATHILRTSWLADGVPLSEVTRRLCERWQPGVRLLPMSDDRVETHVVLDDPDDGERTVHFQEWWVRLHAAVPARDIVAVGAAAARPAPGRARSDRGRRRHRVPAVEPGREHRHDPAGARNPRRHSIAAAAPVVGVSPIIGGAPVRGMADACLTAIGVATTARAVAAHYGSELLDGWLVDDVDADVCWCRHSTGSLVRSRPLLMIDLDATTAIARGVLDLAADLRVMTLEILAVQGIPEVVAGDALAGLIADARARVA